MYVYPFSYFSSYEELTVGTEVIYDVIQIPRRGEDIDDAPTSVVRPHCVLLPPVMLLSAPAVRRAARVHAPRPFDVVVFNTGTFGPMMSRSAVACLRSSDISLMLGIDVCSEDVGPYGQLKPSANAM